MQTHCLLCHRGWVPRTTSTRLSWLQTAQAENWEVGRQTFLCLHSTDSLSASLLTHFFPHLGTVELLFLDSLEKLYSFFFNQHIHDERLFIQTLWKVIHSLLLGCHLFPTSTFWCITAPALFVPLVLFPGPHVSTSVVSLTVFSFFFSLHGQTLSHATATNSYFSFSQTASLTAASLMTAASLTAASLTTAPPSHHSTPNCIRHSSCASSQP